MNDITILQIIIVILAICLIYTAIKNKSNNNEFTEERKIDPEPTKEPEIKTIYIDTSDERLEKIEEKLNEQESKLNFVWTICFVILIIWILKITTILLTGWTAYEMINTLKGYINF